MVDTAPIREWLRLRADVDALKEREKRLATQRDAAERRALDVFEREGISMVRVDGVTVSLQRQLFANVAAADRDRAIEVLDELGLSDLASRTLNSHSLSAYVREQDKLGEPLDERLVDVVSVAELFKLSPRRSTAG